MLRQDIYFAAWAIVLPITSVLVFPSIQGTTPASLLALAAITPPVSLFIIPRDKIFPLFYELALLSFVFVALNAVAPLSLALSGTGPSEAQIEPKEAGTRSGTHSVTRGAQ